MSQRTSVRCLSFFSLALALGACADTESVTGPVDNAPSLLPKNALAAVICTANPAAETLACEVAESASASSTTKSQLRNVIIGGQGQNVLLTSSEVETDGDIFAFSVNVQNLIAQPLGTTNGSTLHPDGVRVFFTAQPVSPQGGIVEVYNADGNGTFTATNQPYFQYDEIIRTGDTTDTKRWTFSFTPEVETFTFTLYVSAEVPFPNGYIDGTPYLVTLNPNESRELRSTVRTVAGRPAADAAPVVWSSTNPEIATVAGSTVTAGGTQGFSLLTATSGDRQAASPTGVSVCQATTVFDGTELSASISSTDCYSTFRNGAPSTTQYGDLYRVVLTAGQTLTVTMFSSSGLDTFLTLASDASGFGVATNDDFPGLGRSSRIIYTATESGLYVIEGSTYYGSDTGNYTLTVTIS